MTYQDKYEYEDEAPNFEYDYKYDYKYKYEYKYKNDHGAPNFEYKDDDYIPTLLEDAKKLLIREYKTSYIAHHFDFCIEKCENMIKYSVKNPSSDFQNNNFLSVKSLKEHMDFLAEVVHVNTPKENMVLKAKLYFCRHENLYGDENGEMGNYEIEIEKTEEFLINVLDFYTCLETLNFESEVLKTSHFNEKRNLYTHILTRISFEFTF